MALGRLFQISFQEIQTEIHKCISANGKKSSNGRSFMDVGSALIIEVKTAFVIVAPVSYAMRDVSRTSNSFWAFVAIKNLVEKYNDHTYENAIATVVFPGLCVGHNYMPIRKSVQQTLDAYNYIDDHDESDSTNLYICPMGAREQPNTIGNREFIKKRITRKTRSTSSS